jgi:hypothetical protein
MGSWLNLHVRDPLVRIWRDQRGQGAELLVLALLVFIVFILTSGRRLFVQ